MEDKPAFRDLYELLLDYKGQNTYQEVLLPWQDKALTIMAGLQDYAKPEAAQICLKKSLAEANAKNLPIEPATVPVLFDSWDWFALSVVNDTLLANYQTPYDQSWNWTPPPLTQTDYVRFINAVGMQPFEKAQFHPFYHEIVAVEPAKDPAEPISILEVIWPGFTFGSMLFSRAGCRVRGGSNFIVKEIAENSTLYFTNIRRNRPVNDLSKGWGGNSRWRTSFRRDYFIEDASGSWYYYNVDGDVRVNEPYRSIPEDMTTEDRTELLTNRCFIKCSKEHSDQWPFADYYVEKAG